jgi:hypothetical protein
MPSPGEVFDANAEGRRPRHHLGTKLHVIRATPIANDLDPLYRSSHGGGLNSALKHAVTLDVLGRSRSFRTRHLRNGVLQLLRRYGDRLTGGPMGVRLPAVARGVGAELLESTPPLSAELYVWIAAKPVV